MCAKHAGCSVNIIGRISAFTPSAKAHIQQLIQDNWCAWDTLWDSLSCPGWSAAIIRWNSALLYLWPHLCVGLFRPPAVAEGPSCVFTMSALSILWAGEALTP